MTLTIKATYENGVLKPKEPLGLAEGTEVEAVLHPLEEEGSNPFEAVIGTCDGPPDGAANHDKYLYGEPGA